MQGLRVPSFHAESYRPGLSLSCRPAPRWLLNTCTRASHATPGHEPSSSPARISSHLQWPKTQRVGGDSSTPHLPPPMPQWPSPAAPTHCGPAGTSALLSRPTGAPQGCRRWDHDPLGPRRDVSVEIMTHISLSTQTEWNLPEAALLSSRHIWPCMGPVLQNWWEGACQ